MNPTAPAGSDLDLRTYLRTLWRRRFIIALAVIALAAAAYASAASQTKLYQSSSQVLVSQSLAESLFDPLRGYQDPTRALANQIRIIQSVDVADRVRKRLGYVGGISASASSTDDIITLTAISPNPKRAQETATAYAEEYVAYRRSSGLGNTQEAQQELQRRIDDAQKQIDLLDQQIAGAPVAQRDGIRTSTDPRRQQLQGEMLGLRQQIDQLQSAANVAGTGTQILSRGYLPTAPFSPHPKKSGLSGAGVGLVLGIGLAFLLDYFDDRIRGKEDVERVAKQLPVLGVIPSVPGWRNRKDAHVVSLEDPSSTTAEAYRTLRTSIQFLGLDRPLKLLQVTSPAASEGKTTTLTNLAVALARAGQRVIIVDCDLRRPRLHEFFGLSHDIGYTSVIVGDVPLSGAIRHVPEVPNLRVLPAGPIPPNPSEVVAGQRTVDLLTALQADSDIVLIDCPPVLPVADAASLSTRVDATLMIVSAEKTHRKQLARALELLGQVEAPVIGVTVNGVGRNDPQAYGYQYSYTPYKQEPQKRKSIQRR